jgi:hypothetical protein
MKPNFDLLMTDRKYQKTFDSFIDVLKTNHENILKHILLNLSPTNFSEALKKSHIEEIETKQFNKTNLFNCNYLDLDSGDYERFYHLCNLYGEDKPIRILTEAMSDELFIPTFVKGTNGIHYLLAGNLEMCAKKVLNILPVVKILPVNFDLQIIF